MKGIMNQNTINELKERIEIHHTLLKTIADMNAMEARFEHSGADLFTPIRYEAEDQLNENADDIYELLNNLYDEWSGIEDLKAKYGRYPEDNAVRQELYDAEDEIFAEHEAVAGIVEFFDTNLDYKKIRMPIDFLREVIKEVPNFEINNDELGIL